MKRREYFFFVILFVLCHCFFLSSKKLDIPGFPVSETIDECVRCKILSDSFTYWMDKTSRGKFEGGDAAWEEANLKSYARSEIRLVEIQEGLCSEINKHQDSCYALADEAEQLLEMWWFKQNPDTADLYSWLCIDTLRYCCPKLHYGELCDPCPVDKDNKICGGYGKCHGEGTRKGNGTCICNIGYKGPNCGDCDKNFYRENDAKCKACHKACEGCSGSGPTSCFSCKSGWILESGECTDINECLISSTCTSKQYCINTEGSHICKNCDSMCSSCSGPGFNKCTACTDDKLLWSGMCINEKLKNDFISKATQRLSLYIGLIVICIFILRKSKILASFVMGIIAIYIYHAETKSRMGILEIIFNYTFNSK